MIMQLFYGIAKINEITTSTNGSTVKHKPWRTTVIDTTGVTVVDTTDVTVVVTTDVTVVDITDVTAAELSDITTKDKINSSRHTVMTYFQGYKIVRNFFTKLNILFEDDQMVSMQ